VIYNVFDQSPEKNLFPLCLKENIGVIIRVPLDEGSLAGTFTMNTTFTQGDWRRDYFKDARLKETVETEPTSRRSSSLPRRFVFHDLPKSIKVMAGVAIIGSFSSRLVMDFTNLYALKESGVTRVLAWTGPGASTRSSTSGSMCCPTIWWTSRTAGRARSTSIPASASFGRARSSARADERDRVPVGAGFTSSTPTTSSRAMSGAA
jgi:hypothetical protein